LRKLHFVVGLAGVVAFLAPVSSGWRVTVSKIGSILALAAPVVLCLAFFVPRRARRYDES
jgi:hypothetical protein